MRQHKIVTWRRQYWVVAIDPASPDGVITDVTMSLTTAEMAAEMRNRIAERVAVRQLEVSTYLDPACAEAAWPSGDHTCFRNTGQPLRPGESCYVQAAQELSGARR